MPPARANVVSSFTVIKGALIPETWDLLRAWDPSTTASDNYARARRDNTVHAKTDNWLRDVLKVLHRRLDPDGRDRSLVALARSSAPLEVFSRTCSGTSRDELLVRDFTTTWLFERWQSGTFRVRAADVVPYLAALRARPDVVFESAWSPSTTARVASALLGIAADFSLLSGTIAREFATYHLPEASFIYLLLALRTTESNARRIVDSADWRLFRMTPADVEAELLRLHQYRRLHYESAGTLARIDLPYASAEAFAQELAA